MVHLYPCKRFGLKILENENFSQSTHAELNVRGRQRHLMLTVIDANLGDIQHFNIVFHVSSLGFLPNLFNVVLHFCHIPVL